MREIRSRRALITGAASGIGRAIALALAREGARLCLVDIDAPGLAQTADLIRASPGAETNAEMICETCDLADPAQIDAMVQRLRPQWGVPHILINNAGIAHYGSTKHMTIDQWRRILAVDLLAPIQLIHAFLPEMLALDEAHIVTISSIFGLVPQRKIAAYQTAKHGLVGLSQSLRVELGGTSVSVSTICPGFVRDSGMNRNKTVADPAHRERFAPAWLCCTAERVAQATVRAIRRDRGLVVITPLARFLWLCHRAAPRLTTWLLRTMWGWRKSRRPGP